jgi:polyhydroxybutyrate depolymerase
MENITFGGFNTRADRDGFAVVYPDGIEQHWNEGLATGQYFAHGIDADDVGFIAALIDLLAKERHIDRKRVYVTGVSNGATMAHRLACELGGKITAIAPVAGNMPTYLASRCAPCGPVSVLLINGTADPIVPWGGGEIEVDRLKLGMVLSVDETAKFWVNHNHCGTTPVLTQEPDGGRVRREVYSGGRGGSEVILYAIEGGGHTWPHAHRFLPEFLTGKTSLDANEVIWNFFKKHSMN